MNNIIESPIFIVFTIAALLVVTLVIYFISLNAKVSKLENKIDLLINEKNDNEN